jgi:DNA-binding beta-propeller fold protein YncE
MSCTVSVRFNRLLVAATLALAAAVMPASAAAAPAPLLQIGGIGSAGTGAGQLMDPFGVAVDGSGDVYVSERGNNRISVFTPAGSFVRAFGFDVAPPDGGTALEVCTTATGCLAGDPGTAAGQLQSPYGIALDVVANRLYVADVNNGRISVFETTGPSFVHAFGWDVLPPDNDSGFETCTSATGCLGGDGFGLGLGKFAFARDVALDGTGRLYVAEQSGNRITVINTAGPTPVHAFGWDVVPGMPVQFEVCAVTCGLGDASGEAGGLAGPEGVVHDGAGRLYVSDTVNSRISVFNTPAASFAHAFGWDTIPVSGSAEFEVCTEAGMGCKFGFEGGGAGQLDHPEDVALAAGNVYAADFDNKRVTSFTTAPAPGNAFGFDVAPPDGGTGFEVCTPATGCLVGDGGTALGQLDQSVAIAADCRGAVWVADENSHSVTRFGEPGTAAPPCPEAPGGPGTATSQKCGGRTATIAGTEGSDRLTGTGKADVIAALGGKDTVRGRGGNDLICGGKGRDRLIGGGGRDILRGEAGKDVCKGGPSKDRGKSCEVRSGL